MKPQVCLSQILSEIIVEQQLTKDVIIRTDVSFEGSTPKLCMGLNEERAYCYRGGLYVYDRIYKATVYKRLETDIGELNFISISPNEKLLLAAPTQGEPLQILDNENGATICTLNNDDNRFKVFGRCGFITDSTFFALNPSMMGIFEYSEGQIRLQNRYDQKISMMRQSKTDPTKALILSLPGVNTKELLEMNLTTLETESVCKWETSSAIKNMFINEDASVVFFRDNGISIQIIEKIEDSNQFQVGRLIELCDGFFSSFMQRGNNFYGVVDYEHLHVWDQESLQLNYKSSFKDTILEMYVTKDSKEILLGSHDGRKLIQLKYKEQEYEGPFKSEPQESIATAEWVSADQKHLYVAVMQEALYEYDLDTNQGRELLRDENIYDIYTHIPHTRKLILMSKDQDDNHFFAFYDFDKDDRMLWKIDLESVVLQFQSDEVLPNNIFYFTENKKVKKLILKEDDSYQVEVKFNFGHYFDENTIDESILQSPDGSLIYITSNTGLYEVNSTSNECTKLSADPCKAIHFGITTKILVAQNTKAGTLDKIDIQSKEVISQLNACNIGFSKKVDKDRLILKHTKNSAHPVSIWNINTDVCEFLIHYEIGNFVPFWLTKQNLFVYEDGNDNTFKSISLKTSNDQNNVQHIGLIDLQNLLPHSTIEYDINEQSIKFYDYSEELMCQLDAKGSNWNEIGIVDQLLNSDTKQKIKIITDNLDQRLLRPFSECRYNIFYEICLQPKLLKNLIVQLHDMENLHQYLMFFKAAESTSALQTALENNQLISVQHLVDGMVRLCDHPLYNYMIDEALMQLIHLGIDLEDYFKSNLPFFEITWETYPNLHYDLSYLVKPFNEGGISAMKNAHDRIFGGELRPEEEGDVLYPISYHVVNMPYALTNQPQEFIKVLNGCDRVNPFEKKVIQIIIDYKWDTYTQQFFLKQFCIFILFAIAFFFDLLRAGLNGEQTTLGSIVSKAICVLILLYFLSYEFRQAQKEGWRTYLSSIWNYVDVLLTLIYIATVSLQIDFSLQGEAMSRQQLAIIQLAYSIIVVFAFIKLCFFMRIFKGLGFLVSMLKEVILDLQFFLLFFFVVLFTFGMIFLILGEDLGTYGELGPMGYVFMSFRTALGDFELDTFTDASDKSLAILWAMWIFWAVAVFFSSIIFLNFIIAVISESYEKVMQKAVARSYQEKVAMIHEMESQFTEVEFKNATYFPQYIIVRSPLEGGDEQEEWQGFVKDIKMALHENQTNIKSNVASLNLSIKKQKTVLTEHQAIIEKRFSKMEEELTKKQDQMAQKYAKLEQQNELMKASIDTKFDQILQKLNST